MAHEWCRKHGLVLADERRLSDPGRSAFHGKHLRQGSPLVRFMEMAERRLLGEHPVLLVEEVDRLTRLAPLDALEGVVLRLIQNGVTLVTLSDESFYNRESMNSGLVDLMKLVLYVQAAHDYSKRLSRRQADNWEGVREKLAEGVITRKKHTAPCWVDWDAKAEQWVLNDTSKTVLRAMQLLKTKGYSQVAKQLNKEGYPPLTSRAKHGWNQSNLSSMIRNSHFIYGAARINKPDAWKPLSRDQNGIAIDERANKGVTRGASGHPGLIVKNVFPPILSEEEVNDVLYCIKGRHRTQTHYGPMSKLHYIGRGVTFCGCCGASMSTCVGGHPPDNLVRYVACRARGSSDRCRAPYIPMNALVKVVLSRLTAHQLGALTGVNDRTEKTIGIQKKLSEAMAQDEAHLRDIAKANDNLKAAMKSLKPELFATVAATIGEEIQTMESDRQDIQMSIARHRAELSRSQNPLGASALIDIINPLKNKLINGESTMEERAQANAAMKQLGLTLHVDTSKQVLGLAINGGEIDWQPIDMELAEQALKKEGYEVRYEIRGALISSEFREAAAANQAAQSVQRRDTNQESQP